MDGLPRKIKILRIRPTDFMTLVEKGYVCKKSRYSNNVNPIPGSIYFLVKPNTNGKKGYVDVSTVQFPNDMIGKWVRFKVELKGDNYEL